MSAHWPLPVIGFGLFAAAPGEKLPEDLEPFIELPGKRFRKLGRFVRLGLAAASRASRSAGIERFPSARTGIFLGSGLGNLPDLFGFAQAAHDLTGELMPSPIQFANSVGNSAAFYIAQAFELSGPVLALSQEEVSFESALISAACLLEANDIDLALVGALDIFQPDEVEHVQRMGYEPPLTAGEGSAWLVLARPGSEWDTPGALGSIQLAQMSAVGDPSQLLESTPQGEGASLWLNPRLAPLWERAGGRTRFDPKLAFFPTGNAGAICAFLQEPGGSGTLHTLVQGRDGELGHIAVERRG